PHKFTQAQLFACLVLKEFYQLDFRKLQELLKDCPDLQKAIQLNYVPHFSTLHKASQRLLRAPWVDRLLGKTIEVAQICKRLPCQISLAALDGTGWESHHASSYYVERCKKGQKTKQKLQYKRFP